MTTARGTSAPPHWTQVAIVLEDGRVHCCLHPCRNGCKSTVHVYQFKQDGRLYFRCPTCLQYSYLERIEIVANEQLYNGTLEGPYNRRDADEVIVAPQWEPWFDGGKRRPEWKEETRGTGKGRVHTGESAQKWFTLFGVHDAGIWQRVNATPGQWYRLRAWLYMWSSEQDDPDTSYNPGKMHAMVGLNPWGHWPAHPATVWGKELGQDQYNQWIQAEAIVQAWHDEISVCVRSYNEWKAKHNDLYVDNITLDPIQVTIGDPGQQPPPGGGPIPPTPIDYDLIATMTSIRTINLLADVLKGDR